MSKACNAFKELPNCNGVTMVVGETPIRRKSAGHDHYEPQGGGVLQHRVDPDAWQDFCTSDARNDVGSILAAKIPCGTS